MKMSHIFIILLLSLSFCACAGKTEQTVVPAVQLNSPDKAVQSVPDETIKSASDTLLVIGQAEYISFPSDNIRLKARIDTGATTSSIHATEIKEFERDGKKWVRFTLHRASGEKVELQKAVVRIIEVKRHGAERQRRPVVSLNAVMGPIKKVSQFSLTDRSQFEFPVLIGRSFLKATALVDVNQEYTLSPLLGGDSEK